LTCSMIFSVNSSVSLWMSPMTALDNLTIARVGYGIKSNLGRQGWGKKPESDRGSGQMRFVARVELPIWQIMRLCYHLIPNPRRKTSNYSQPEQEADQNMTQNDKKETKGDRISFYVLPSGQSFPWVRAFKHPYGIKGKQEEINGYDVRSHRHSGRWSSTTQRSRQSGYSNTVENRLCPNRIHATNGVDCTLSSLVSTPSITPRWSSPFMDSMYTPLR